MLNSKFEDLKLFLKGKKIIITTHDAVDIDGLASCVSLKHYLKHLFESSEITLCFSEITKRSSEFLLKFKSHYPAFDASYEKNLDISQYDIILILDTNNLKQVRVLNKNHKQSTSIPFLFIDHHSSSVKNYDMNLSNLNLIDDAYSSTCEIIFNLIASNEKFFLSESLRCLLLAGILTDSGFFKYANNDTLIHTSKLLEDIEFQEVLQLLKSEPDISEKIAKIKGLQRVQLIQEGNWLIGITNVGSFEARVATSLIKIGFDVGVVYSKKKSEYRISTRAKKNVCLKTGLHLGKILEELSDDEISGGGHDGAAAIHGKEGLEELLAILIEKVKQSLSK